MDYQMFPLPFLMISGVLFSLFFGLRGILKNRPLVINTRLMMIAFVPMIIDLILIPFSTGINNSLSVLFVLIPSLLLLLLSVVLFLYTTKDYSIYFVTESDFRNALIFALKKNSIIFEEQMNNIELVEMKNTLKVMYYLYYGMIGIKNKKDKKIFKEIIKDIRIYFKENKIK